MIGATLGHIDIGVALLPSKFQGFRCPPRPRRFVLEFVGRGAHPRGVHTAGRSGVRFLARWQARNDTRWLSNSFRRAGLTSENL